MTNDNQKFLLKIPAKEILNHAADIADKKLGSLVSDLLAAKAENVDAATLASEAHETRQLTMQVQTKEFISSFAPADIMKIYCSKTGRPIGIRTEETISELLETFGVDHAQRLSQFITLTSGVAPRWIRTNPEDLEKLQIADPVGFFIYAISHCLQHKQADWSIQRNCWKTTEAQLIWQNNKAKTWEMMQSLPKSKIIEANHILCNTLALVAPTRIKWPFNSIDQAASEVGLSVIINQIQKSVKREIASIINWRHLQLRDQTLLDELAKKLGGNAVFRRIGQLPGSTIDVQIRTAMQALDFDLDIQSIPTRTYTGVKREKPVKPTMPIFEIKGGDNKLLPVTIKFGQPAQTEKTSLLDLLAKSKGK